MNDLGQLRDEAVGLVGAQAAEADARTRVIREMYDAGLSAMAEKLLIADAETTKARALFQAETLRSQALQAELEQRDAMLRDAAERERERDERIATLEIELEDASGEARISDAARERSEVARREAVARAHQAADDAERARAEADEARRQQEAAYARATIATSEAATARIEAIQTVARARLETAELQERLAAALAERSAAMAERDEAVRLRDEMQVRLRETMAITSAAKREASEARLRAENAEGAVKAVTSARITFVGDARGIVAANARSDS